MPPSLAKALEPFGARPDEVLDLRRGPTPEGLPYLDLILAKDRASVPDGIVKGRGEALAYVVDQRSHRPPVSLPHLQRTVTLRGDAPYLAVLEPGRLTVFAADSYDPQESQPLDALFVDEDRARTTFSRLNLGLDGEERQRFDVNELLFGLLTDAIAKLVEHGIGSTDAVSLAGRALFTRFLLDRAIVTEHHLPQIDGSARRGEDLFTGRARVEATCRWLDVTFNGDFLPLENDLGLAESFGPLEDILYRSPGGQRVLDWGWDDLDFAHIPIGLLSQVYERQASVTPARKRRESLYYTPHRLAEYMVHEVFANLRESGPVPAHEARVLDPAVGGGVFLVAAFQELVAEWWQHHRRPPDTSELRQILTRQLAGFEINEQALRLTALSLYLKTIELDLDPHPPEKLRFPRLRGTVLHLVRDGASGEAGALLGSLGPAVGTEHQGAYDVVLGNPPWTALKGAAGRQAHREVVAGLRPIVGERLGEEAAKAFEIPDLVPDLPFVWRALQWCKPSGWIAFALHGRLLFKTSAAGRTARGDLFGAMRVRGVVNGADLRTTEVWPKVTAPFCLLFAENATPEPKHGFRFVSPYQEKSLNRQGRLRIDHQAAHPVEVSRLLERPDLLKILFRGTALDAGVLDKIRARQWPTLAQCFPGRHGVGYQTSSSRQAADFLLGMPDLTSSYAGPLLISAAQLPRFTRPRVHFRRQRKIYEAPLVILRQSLPRFPSRGRAFLCLDDLAYSESFFGFSTHEHRGPLLLAKQLLLVLHSELFLWHVLMTSSKFGVERDLILKEDAVDLPLFPPEHLTSDLQGDFEPLVKALVRGDEVAWPGLNQWVCRAYGLDRWDEEVIRDTLSVSLPYSDVVAAAQCKPTSATVEAFVDRLKKELAPFVRATGRILDVRRLPGPFAAPWEVLMVNAASRDESRSPKEPPTGFLSALLDLADREGASLAIQVSPGRLLLAVLGQQRYWTPTRARLCALEIVQEHLGALFAER